MTIQEMLYELQIKLKIEPVTIAYITNLDLDKLINGELLPHEEAIVQSLYFGLLVLDYRVNDDDILVAAIDKLHQHYQLSFDSLETITGVKKTDIKRIYQHEEVCQNIKIKLMCQLSRICNIIYPADHEIRAHHG